ncbi:MAG: lysophospholipid acyltransferase family protein, partial [Leptothrix sp. (in: b-proteobacteria)]
MIHLLRSVLYVLWLAITVMPWALVAVAMSAFVRGPRLYWVCAGWLKTAIWGARWICGVRWRLQGMEHVPTAADGQASVILVPKHQSTWETFAFPALMPHPLAYVFKRELLYIPFFGWAIGRLDMVHIDRARRAEAWRKVVEQGTAIMARGTWMIMFPEGTRTARGEKGDYKTGASRLAITTGMPLVPIAVTSARCWPRKSFI